MYSVAPFLCDVQMKYVTWLAALLTFAGYASDSTLSVVAVEYPPYVTQSRSDLGSNFVALQAYLRQQNLSDVHIRPLFYPPARAQKAISDEQWCATFYPPWQRKDVRFVPLGNEVVKMGLFRNMTDSPFRWNELTDLSGKSVALLRSSEERFIPAWFKQAGKKIVFVETVEQGLELLLLSRVDYAFGDEHALERLSAEVIGEQRLQFSETLLATQQVGLFIRNDCWLNARLQQNKKAP